MGKLWEVRFGPARTTTATLDGTSQTKFCSGSAGSSFPDLQWLTCRGITKASAALVAEDEKIEWVEVSEQPGVVTLVTKEVFHAQEAIFVEVNQL